jgi:hypothetical protein
MKQKQKVKTQINCHWTFLLNKGKETYILPKTLKPSTRFLTCVCTTHVAKKFVDWETTTYIRFRPRHSKQTSLSWIWTSTWRLLQKLCTFSKTRKLSCPNHVYPSPRTYKEPNNKKKWTTIGRGNWNLGLYLAPCWFFTHLKNNNH